MTMQFEKDTRKRRGSRVHGFGRVGQHRGTGHKGGMGLTTGWCKYKWNIVMNQRAQGWPDPRWKIGKLGFKRPPKTIRKYTVNTLKLKDLDLRIDKFVEQNKAIKSGNNYKIDFDAINVQKLLGSGNVTKKIEVTVHSATEKAINKIEAAGGKVITKAE